MTRLSHMVALMLVGIGLSSCGGPPETEPLVWDNIKLGDIANARGDKTPSVGFLATTAFDVQVIDLPADNVEKLDELWRILTSKPIRTNSYNAFSENGFRVRFGRIEKWQDILKLLVEAGGQKTSTTSLVLTNDELTDLPIADIPNRYSVSFVAGNLAWQKAEVGPGMIALRFRGDPVPGARGVRKIIAYPVYTLPIMSTIPQLEAKTRDREFYFASAAFAAQMGPGDLVVLGPDKYTGERNTLGGLFFNQPQGTLFFDPSTRKPPERKPAVRVFILVCSGIND